MVFVLSLDLVPGFGFACSLVCRRRGSSVLSVVAVGVAGRMSGSHCGGCEEDSIDFFVLNHCLCRLSDSRRGSYPSPCMDSRYPVGGIVPEE